MTYARSRIDAHNQGDCDALTCPLCAEEDAAEDFRECEPCGLRSEDVENCDHGVTACPDCRNEGACHLCDREAVGAA